MSRSRLPAVLVANFVVSPSVFAADFDHALIIIVDDVGTDKIGAYAADVANPGEDRPDTVNVDLLAGAGVRFSDAWASPSCSPTRAMVYSGEYAYRNGVGAVIKEGSSTRLGTSRSSLAKLATDAGLKAGLFGKWHVGETSTTPDAPTSLALSYKEYPIQVGFSYFAGNMDGELSSYTNWLYTQSAPSGTSSRYSTTATTVTTSATDRTTDDAEAWMSTQSSLRKRRLTVVSYNMPHATKNSSGNWTWQDAASSCGVSPTSDEVANYRAAAECMDDEIAELLAGTPDLDRTLVIMLGDNGTEAAVTEGRFDDGRGKSTVYESGVRVPFIVADGAAVEAALAGASGGGSGLVDVGAVSPDPASVVDIYATVADFLGLSSSSCTVGVSCARDSVSLRSVLQGGAPSRDEVWTETFSRNSAGKYTGSAALRFGDYKLVVRVSSAASPCRSYELYDLTADRWEEQDLADDPAYADELDTLVDLLDQHATTMSSASVKWLPSGVCA